MKNGIPVLMKRSQLFYQIKIRAIQSWRGGTFILTDTEKQRHNNTTDRNDASYSQGETSVCSWEKKGFIW